MEGYSEALRYELLPFNIFVSLVEPGQIQADTLASSNIRTEKSTTYDADQIVMRAVEEGNKASLKPTDVARTVARIVDSPYPRFRYKVGEQVRIGHGNEVPAP